MTLLSSVLHVTNFKHPFLRTLIPSVGAAFAIQTAVAIPSILAETERFYDLSGSVTYLGVTALSLYLPTLRARAAATVAGGLKPSFPSLLDAFRGKSSPNGLNWRQVVLSAAVGFWACRCKLFSLPKHGIRVLTKRSRIFPLSTSARRRQRLPLRRDQKIPT
jgi:hypothetical protein